MAQVLEIAGLWGFVSCGQFRCLLELGGAPVVNEFEQSSEMRSSQVKSGVTRR